MRSLAAAHAETTLAFERQCQGPRQEENGAQWISRTERACTHLGRLTCHAELGLQFREHVASHTERHFIVELTQLRFHRRHVRPDQDQFPAAIDAIATMAWVLP